jgi:hypothetical protein
VQKKQRPWLTCECKIAREFVVEIKYLRKNILVLSVSIKSTELKHYLLILKKNAVQST